MLLRWRPNRHQFRTATTDVALISESRGGGYLKVMSNPWALISCDEVVYIPTFVMHPILLFRFIPQKAKRPQGLLPEALITPRLRGSYIINYHFESTYAICQD
jgi:hypothetical protein